MYAVRLVTSASDEEIERMTDALHEAFSYRYFLTALGSPERSRALLKAQVKAALVEPAAELYVAEDEDAVEVAGVAVWFGPGTVWMLTDEQRAAGWNDLYASLDSDLQVWWSDFISAYTDYATFAFGPWVKPGGYHLQVIGVRPGYQRQGIARQFLSIVEAKARSRGVCTCLEAIGEGAVSVFSSLGYEVKPAVDVRMPLNVLAPLRGFIKTFL
ncbi:hypothetical protein EXIGLDRAFT_725536 [Exidia glandulosa HHB12029]|uniref:N-acetyltransferase domain-containing protein n=1 Tax=Exidia glandulosa HHB12029 TaxID=1314781 RepID=A0A165DZ83_EXIGL|nr:hypothetical protein EXIGLDRAFT_725536 [Exidia glandulosa HHB12029]